MKSSISLLLKVAAKFSEIIKDVKDPFDFFKIPTDSNQARDDNKRKPRDHASMRAFERTTASNAEVAKDHAMKILTRLYGEHRELVFQLPEGSEWWVESAGGLKIIFKKTNNQLVLATFLLPDHIIPRSVNGNLTDKIEELYSANEEGRF